MSGIAVWLEVDKIRVENRIRKNYSHLADFINELKDKSELEIPLLVACRQCLRSECDAYSVLSGSKNTDCKNNRLAEGLCLDTACLLDGATRLEAAKKLKWHKINCIIVEKKGESWMKEVEIITNTMRKPFDLWEKVEAALVLEAPERMMAQSRAKAGVARKSGERGRWRDMVAKKAGFKSANSFLAAKKVYLDAHPRIRTLVENGLLKITQAAMLAKLPEYRQVQAGYLIEKSVELNKSNGKKSSATAGFIVHNIVPFGNLAQLIINKINAGEIKSCDEFRQIAQSAPDNRFCPSPDALAQKNFSRCAQSEPDKSELEQCVCRICENLAGLIVTEQVVGRLSKADTIELDKNLSKILGVVKTCRDYLRIKSAYFDNSFSSLVKENANVFRQSVRFFSTDFSRQIKKVDRDLAEDLHYTFHNAVTILHKTALLAAQKTRI